MTMGREQGLNSLDSVNWDIISEEVYEGKFSSSDCIFEFLKLPISESLKLDFETQGAKCEEPLDVKKPVGNDSVPWNTSQASASVFMDASNPLLSQVAIFARLLELREKGAIDEKKGLLKENGKEDANPVRTTRNKSK